MMFSWFDSNQRLNDQGLIDLQLPHISHTSIFPHKSKSNISKRTFRVDSKHISYSHRNQFPPPQKKKLFQEMGASACACGGPKARLPHFFESAFF